MNIIYYVYYGERIIHILGVKVEDIGIIGILDYISYVDILNGKGDMVLKALKTINI
ncbi:MAG: DbpA RNA binding domain-containing protein [Lutispora sp.]|nr:DbpA RNA binding domain-containing protein [Lutispora sp.]